MRYPVISLLLVLGMSHHARAEYCHIPATYEPNQTALSVGLSSSFTTFNTASYTGSYEGLSLNTQLTYHWLHVRASMPTYRIERNGLTNYGTGDVLLDLRASLLPSDQDTWAMGLELSSTLPTGDASKSLGMGHVMLMPGVWGAWRSERASITAQVLYGRMLRFGSGGHHNTPPIVNPMNASEIEGALSAGYRLFEYFRVRAGSYGAAPVAAENGKARAAAFVGGDVLLGRWELGLEGHIPYIGDPFTAKGIMSVSAHF